MALNARMIDGRREETLFSIGKEGGKSVKANGFAELIGSDSVRGKDEMVEDKVRQCLLNESPLFKGYCGFGMNFPQAIGDIGMVISGLLLLMKAFIGAKERNRQLRSFQQWPATDKRILIPISSQI
jgi:hypothetical protein